MTHLNDRARIHTHPLTHYALTVWQRTYTKHTIYIHMYTFGIYVEYCACIHYNTRANFGSRIFIWYSVHVQVYSVQLYTYITARLLCSLCLYFGYCVDVVNVLHAQWNFQSTQHAIFGIAFENNCRHVVSTPKNNFIPTSNVSHNMYIMMMKLFQIVLFWASCTHFYRYTDTIYHIINTSWLHCTTRVRPASPNHDYLIELVRIRFVGIFFFFFFFANKELKVLNPFGGMRAYK